MVIYTNKEQQRDNYDEILFKYKKTKTEKNVCKKCTVLLQLF